MMTGQQPVRWVVWVTVWSVRLIMVAAKQTVQVIVVGAVMTGRLAAFWRSSTCVTVSRRGWINPGGRTAT